MQLIPTDFGWLLRMDEGRIRHIGVDFRLVLLFGDKTETASLCIETPCYIRSEGKNTRLVPDAPSTLAPALTLFNAEIADILILKTGYLVRRMAFCSYVPQVVKLLCFISLGQRERNYDIQLSCPAASMVACKENRSVCPTRGPE